MIRESLLAIVFSVAVLLLAPLTPAAEQEPQPNKQGRDQAAKLPKVTVSRETTHVTSPLKADGSVDFVAAINQQCSQGVTPENNAAISFWKAVGPKGINEKVRRSFFAGLGIPELPVQGDYLVSFGDFVASNQVSGVSEKPDGLPSEDVHEHFERAQKAPWTPADFPEVAALLKKNAEPLRVLAEGSKRTQYYSPLVNKTGDSLVDIELAIGSGELREAVRQLAAQGMLRLGSGDVDGAWSDVVAGSRLAQLFAQQPLFIDRVIAIASQDVVNQMAVALSQSPKVSAAHLAEFQSQWTKLSQIPRASETWNGGERLYGLSYVCDMAVNREKASAWKAEEWWLSFADDAQKKRLQAFKKLLPRNDIDWNEALRDRNALTDRAIQAMDLPSYKARFDAMKQIEAEDTQAALLAADEVLSPSPDKQATTPQAATRQVAALLNGPGPLGFTFTAAVRIDARYHMQRQLVLLAFALARYQRDHHKYPELLADLQPDYLPSIPCDIFNNDRPLHYKTDGKGYMLYSVGINGKDDKGRSFLAEYKDLAELNSASEEEKSWDDIAIRTPDWKPGKR